MSCKKYLLSLSVICLFVLSKIVSAETDSSIKNNNIIKIRKNEATIKKNDSNSNTVNTDKNSNNFKQPKIHIVKDGENIYRISLKYKIKQNDLIKLNNISNNVIKIGQKLKLPDNAIDIQTEQAGTTVINHINEGENKEKGKNSINNNGNEIKISNQNDKHNEQKDKGNGNVGNKLQPIHQSTFIWPVRGVVVSKFGSIGKNNIMLEGNNIATEKDAIVRASSSGVISYNDKVEGYDNVILIKHYNGFFTAYGHVESTVSVGDKVTKGQIIGYVKPTINSKRAVLYFSIRKKNKSYDPEKIIQTKIND